MTTHILHSTEFPEGYRMTSVGSSLLIEATVEHPRPLRLRREHMAGLGLRPLDADRARAREADLVHARQVRFGMAILILALVTLLLFPAVLSGW